jgi:CHAT domain-containing protein
MRQAQSSFLSCLVVFRPGFLRWTAIGILIIFIMLTASVAQSATVIQSGDKLVDSVSFVLDFSKDAEILVGASQSFGDFKLTLKDSLTDTVVKQVNASADKGFDELLLVKRSDCSVCVIELSATAFIDTQSKFEVWVEPLQNLSLNQRSYSKAVQFFEQYTVAMTLFARAEGIETDSGQKFVDDATAVLENLVSKETHGELEEYRLVALSLLSEAYDHSGRAKDFERILQSILDATVTGFTAIRAYALYESGPTKSDAQEQRNFYDLALDIAETSGDKRLFAKVANRKAINLVRDGRVSYAIELLKEARDINQSEGQLLSLIKNLGNLSWANQRANMLPDALKYAAEQKLIAEKYKQEVYVLWSLYYFGITYGKLGERAVADRFLDVALKRAQQQDANDQSSSVALTGYILQELANRLIEYDEFNDAMNKAEAMRALFVRHGKESRVVVADAIIAEIAFNTGNISLARAKLDSVIVYHRDARHQRALGSGYLTYAELEFSQYNFVEASKNINKALNLLSLTEDYHSLAQALSLSIDVLRKLGGAKESSVVSSQSRDVIVQNLEESELSEYWYRDSLTALELDQTDTALISLQIARSHIESALPKIKQRDLRRRYLGLQKMIFEKSIDTLMARNLDGTKEALLLAESFKARTLEDRLSVDLSLVRKTKQQEIERKEIHDQLLSYALEIRSGVDDADISVLERSRVLSKSLAVLEQKVLDQRVRPFVNKSSRNINLDELMVKDGELIAVYFTGAEKSWLWQISSGQVQGHLLPPQSEIDELAEALVINFSVPPKRRKNRDLEHQKKIIVRLSEAVLSPIASSLISGQITELSIVPDGSLFGVPFAALSLTKDQLPLVSQMSLSYSPSLTSRQLLRDKNIGAVGSDIEALVFANSGYQEISENNFGLIPFSEIEADYIATALGSKVDVYKGLNANKEKLSELLENKYKVIHLATHGLLNNEVSDLSGLSFPSADGETSLWLIPEISNTQIQAELVFLSACETAIGKSIPGEGLIGLSRAFLEAGAKNVVGTLWNVQDKVTAELVRDFYTSYFGSNQSYEKALQYAQRRVIENTDNEWADPYYWAGFQLIGEG